MTGSLSLASISWHLAGLFCHQLPDRSPQFEGAIFPLCFRCAGLYLSLLTTFVCLAVRSGCRWRHPDVRCAISISALTIPFLLDGWANLLGVWSSPGWIRALTGMGVGLVLPIFLAPLTRQAGAGLVPIGRMKPTVSTSVALMPSAIISLALLWLVAHPMQLPTFHILAGAAACAPVVFVFTFLHAGWQNRDAVFRTLGIASGDVPC